jgi:formate-dependent nitrite reductase membrane component NrfD
LARLGYYIAFPCVIISGILLTFDLTRPERFWHMLIESNTLRPMLKYWSPMSLGSWALTIFGFFALLSFLGALADAGRVRWSGAQRLRPPVTLGRVISVIGGLFGFYVAGYTGVLLAVTNRPIWSDTPLLGMLFVVSAASISAALMILLAPRYGWVTPGLQALHRIDLWVIVLEFLVLIAVLVSLGPVARAWLNAWGLLLFFGVIVIGMLIPVLLYWRTDWLGERNMTAAAALILVGGFILRIVIVFSAQGIYL